MMTLQQVARALGGEISAGQVLAPGPNHTPKDRSLSIKLDAIAPGGFVVHSFAGDDPIICKDYVRQKLGLPPFGRDAGTTGPKPKAVATYDYADEQGELLFQVVRYEPKNFRQRRPDGNGGWLWQLGDTRRVIYRLPEILEAIANEQTIFIVEGEKAADALAELSVPATCSPSGAGKWRDEYSKHFVGAIVVILPDADEQGEQHAEEVQKALTGIAASVKVVRLPGLPPKGDPYDWIERGGAAAMLWNLVENGEARERRLIQLSRDFVLDFVPPDYLIEGLLQRRYFYSFTARTGDGKTAVALAAAAHVALGRQLGGRDVEKGKVLYFAGENPTDVKMRWIAMAERMQFDADIIEVYFIEGAFHFKEVAERVRQEVDALGLEFSFIVLDTSAAYFDGEQENDNAQHGDYARRLRALTKLPGGPTVLVLCHPVKNASSDNLVPRGGGAYLAEVDGNLTCLLTGKVLEVHWQGKFRGINFEPWHFELVEVTADRLKDQKGEKIATVMARPLDDREHSKKMAETRNEEEMLLVAMLDNPEASVADLGRACEWLVSRGKDIGKPQKSKVSNKLTELKKAGMVRNTLGTWELTEKGTKHAEKIKAKIRSEEV
jgi:hypothetical protein